MATSTHMLKGLPHMGAGGGIPAPSKLRANSTTMAQPTCRVLKTTTANRKFLIPPDFVVGGMRAEKQGRWFP